VRAIKLARMTDNAAPNGLVAPVVAAPIPAAVPVPTAFGLPTDFGDQMRFAEIVSKSDLVDKKLQGKPENVFMVVQKAIGLNISFDLAIAQTHVIDNKVSPSAELLRILLRRAGHDLDIYEHNDKVAKASLTLAHRPAKPITMEYTIAKAQAAGLTSKSVWKQHAESMLVAAVTRLLVRFHCPEVAAGLSLDDETAGAEFGANDTAAHQPPAAVRANAERLPGPSGGADHAGHAGHVDQPDPQVQRAQEVLDEALAATDVATLTSLGKVARSESLLDLPVGDTTLKAALMDRLHELESGAAAAN
jgi:hypothetical protein